jgi:hypothetical protein
MPTSGANGPGGILPLNKALLDTDIYSEVLKAIDPDPMIAALALTRGLVLVTGNIYHFQRIQQLGYPLLLANWRI